MLTDRASIPQRLRNGGCIDIFKLSAHRHAAGQPGHPKPPGPKHFAQVVRGGFAFLGEVGGQDHLAHHAIGGPRQQLLEMISAGPMPSRGESLPISTK